MTTNKWVIYEAIRFLARLGGNHTHIYNACKKLISKAKNSDNYFSLFCTELGFLKRVHGKVEEALSEYKNAMILDGNNIRAIYGAIHCHILLGNLEDTEQQFEFLSAFKNNDVNYDKDPEFLLVRAIFARRRYQDESKHI